MKAPEYNESPGMKLDRGLPLSIGWPTDPPAKEPVGVAFTTDEKLSAHVS